MQDEYLIYKAGRGWYRPASHGYTNYRHEAGRFSREQAESYTHPNGPYGPRDGLTYEPVTKSDTRADPALAAAQAEVARWQTAAQQAVALIDEINERKSSRAHYGIEQGLHGKLCSIRATLARAALVQP